MDIQIDSLREETSFPYKYKTSNYLYGLKDT